MSTPKPGTYNWTQFAGDLPDGMVDRMSQRVLLTHIPRASEEVSDRLLDATLSPEEIASGLDENDRIELDTFATEAGVTLTPRTAEVGRGASGGAIALEIFFNTTSLIGSAIAMREAYKQYRVRFRRSPLVSLAAAEHLAAADFIDRFACETIELIGSGDLNSKSDDRAFTGGDAFYVFLAESRSSAISHYAVSAYGEVHFIGTSPAIPNHFDALDPFPNNSRGAE